MCKNVLASTTINEAGLSALHAGPTLGSMQCWQKCLEFHLSPASRLRRCADKKTKTRLLQQLQYLLTKARMDNFLLHI